MNRYTLYKIPIAYMLLFILFILFTGVWSFLLSQGFSESGSILSVLEKIIVSPIEKSMHNFVEISTPHLFAMGTLIFVLAHFMLFSTKIRQKVSLFTSVTLYLLALLNIVAYLFIMFGWVTLGWIKFFSLFLFVGMFLVLLFMVGLSL